MFRFFALVILFFSGVCYAQVNEDFSDGDLSSSPQWTGDISTFSVDSELRLQLTAPAESSEAVLFAGSRSIENASWKIRVILGFNPSSNNFVRIYLATNALKLSEMTHAVYVEIGQATDDISLFALSGGQTIKLIDGADDRVDLSSPDIKLEVTRQGDKWTLRSDTGNGYITEGRADYAPEFGSEYFGIYCKYTSTRSNKFWFDDIEVTGDPFVDIKPPYISDFRILNGENIDIIFSESIDTIPLSPENFKLEQLNREPSLVTALSGEKLRLHFVPALTDVTEENLSVMGIADLSGNILRDTFLVFDYKRVSVTGSDVISAKQAVIFFSIEIDENSLSESIFHIYPGELSPQPSLKEARSVMLSFDEPMTDGTTYQLTLSGVKDISGDTIITTTLPLLYYMPHRYDVVFSETMPDPSPSAGLPESEFIEIFNRSGYPLNLNGWQLKVNGKAASLEGYILKPYSFVLLIPENKAEKWDMVKNKLQVKNWPVLNNNSSEIVLTFKDGRVSDALRFDLDTWSDGTFKQDGGWSFERIDANNLSGEPDTWAYSVDPSGGTPGKVNSVMVALPDDFPPKVKLITYKDPLSIELWFTEAMNIAGDLSVLFKVKGNTAVIAEVIPDTVFADNCTVRFQEELQTNSKHEFASIGMKDNAGNETEISNNRFFGRPDAISPTQKDVVINEILFNPRPEGVDFIEIFNRSQKIINLSTLFFAECDDNDNDKITKLFPAASKNILIFPEDYPVFTPSPTNIKYEYNCKISEQLYSVRPFPAMTDEKGTVTLTLRDGTVIDRLHYSRDMHFPLINDTEGISLERVSPGAPTDDPDNWHSASADCGYATPTAINSQFRDVQQIGNNSFNLEEELFTPNSDGYSDQLIINYSFDTPETVATVTVFNAKGIPVKELANNKLLGTSGFLTWDGTNDDGSLVAPGIYIILIKTFNRSGKTETEKITCVVGTGKGTY